MTDSTIVQIPQVAWDSMDDITAALTCHLESYNYHRDRALAVRETFRHESGDKALKDLESQHTKWRDYHRDQARKLEEIIKISKRVESNIYLRYLKDSSGDDGHA